MFIKHIYNNDINNDFISNKYHNIYHYYTIKLQLKINPTLPEQKIDNLDY